ncbi:hypothetical protein [Streptomyces malaysiensis]
MGETFKADDAVTIGASIVRQRVEAGPFASGDHDAPFYVVSNPDRTLFRTAFAATMHRIIPEDEWEAGGTVKIQGDTHTLLAGPFSGYSTWWAVRDTDGLEVYAERRGMTDYQPPAPAPETFEYLGVTYEVGATYADREGDRWTLEELPVDELHGYVWRMTGAVRRNLNHTAHIVRVWGPLKKVSD